VLCLPLFASFCFAIVIVCAPNPFFLSHFTLSLVACWLSLIRRLHILGGSSPWLQSWAVLLLGPVPRPRWWCSCSVPSSASAVLGSSALSWWSFSAAHLIAFDSVLRTKPSALPRCSSSASPRCSPSVSWCSARKLRPWSLPRPQRSSVLWPCFSAPPWLLAFDLVLRTKPSASPRSSSSLAPRCSPSVPRCSALILRPQGSSSVLSSGKFLFCSTICHPFFILHFAHSTSTSLSHPADRYFSPLLFVSISLDFLHSFFALFFASFPFTLFPFDYDLLRYKINLIKYPFSNQTKSNKNTIVTLKKYNCNIKKTTVIFSNYGLNN
jgi:hypothetical protein